MISLRIVLFIFRVHRVIFLYSSSGKSAN